ncbi:MAG: hypothetical protein H0T47_24255 [Planctomycetaceae bacterium]|nr:hypothetical protein [Planctomycetaceae bacterium]
MLNRLLNLDRRWIFAAMALAVGVPILVGARFPEKPTTMTRQVFASVESLPPGSRVLIALDYDPAGMGELQPMAAAFTRHAALRGHRIYFLTLWPTGPAFLADMTRLLRTEFPQMEEGRDYVNLGYRAGEMGVIKLIVNNLRDAFATDVRQRNLDSMPITSGVKNIRQMDLIVSVSGGTPGSKEWVQFASTPFDIETVSGTTGVQTSELMPYYPSQLNGILGGVKAAAEYERLLVDKYPEIESRPIAAPGLFSGTIRMGPQLVAHLLMIGLIVAGNVLYFAARRQGASR